MNKESSQPLRRCAALLVTGILALAGGCSDGEGNGTATEGNGKPQVLTVNYPLYYFAERIGGDAIEVHFPAPADEDPAYWEPEAEDIALYQEADRILLNGADYAKWISTVSLAPSRLVDTSRGFTDRLIEEEDAVVHQHGPDGTHTHEGLAFTTWLDPQLALEHAREVTESLADLVPEEETEALRARFREFESELQELDQTLEQITADAGSVPLVASHPVYQYLERRYGLKLESVHWEPDTEPTESAWQELEELLEDHPAGWMIWEDEPLEATRARLSEMGVRSVVVRPCGNRPPQGDWMSVMRENAENLRAVFAGDAETGDEN